MKVYELGYNSKKTPWLEYANEEEKLDHFLYYRKPLLNTWKMPQLKCRKVRKNNPPADIVGFDPYTISERAMNALKDLIGNQAEFLPIQYEDTYYYIINVLNEVDALDYNLSIIDYYLNGEIYTKKGIPTKEDGKITHIPRINLVPEKICGNHVFTLKGEPFRSLYVSDDFKKIIDDNHFAAFDFKLIWDEDIDYEALDAEKERLKNRESYFPVVRWAAATKDSPFIRDLQFMKKNFKYKLHSGLFMAKQISKDVDLYLQTKTLPDGFENLDAFSSCLTNCYIDSFCILTNYTVKEVGDESTVSKALISTDDENYAFFINEHMKNILEGKNPNGNDLLELLESIPKMKPGEKKYMPIY